MKLTQGYVPSYGIPAAAVSAVEKPSSAASRQHQHQPTNYSIDFILKTASPAERPTSVSPSSSPPLPYTAAMQQMDHINRVHFVVRPSGTMHHHIDEGMFLLFFMIKKSI